MRLTLALLLAAAGELAAQEAPGAAAAARTIGADDVRRRVSIIADDSMLGRETPGPGLERAAAYIAGEMRRLGLAPLASDGSFLQRYEIARTAFATRGSSLVLRAARATARLSFRSDARFVGGGAPAGAIDSGVVVVAGLPAAGDSARIAGRTALVVAPARGGERRAASALDAIVARVAAAGASVIVIVSSRDSASFAERVAQQSQPRLTIGAPAGAAGADAPVVEVRERAVRAVLAAAGVNVARLRAARAGSVRALPALGASLTIATRVIERQTAPNVVGMLEGTDSTLKHEYVVFSAHVDHVGVGAPRAGSRDSIYNGADDDASGTAGVLELAEAFASAGARPRRSLIFLTVSGEEKGLWGSQYFVEHPPVPMSRIVADLNMDMIGRNWRDTIVAIGKEHSDLGATLGRVARAHPELRMQAIDDLWPAEGFYYRSDHFNFARKGVPILFFFNGTHDDYHEASDEPAKIDAEKEARVVRLVYWLGAEIANARERPRWREESYRKIVEPR